ncbi:hypothetical protein GIB67_018619, partial [Kingdonia uniflora]
VSILPLLHFNSPDSSSLYLYQLSQLSSSPLHLSVSPSPFLDFPLQIWLPISHLSLSSEARPIEAETVRYELYTITAKKKISSRFYVSFTAEKKIRIPNSAKNTCLQKIQHFEEHFMPQLPFVFSVPHHPKNLLSKESNLNLSSLSLRFDLQGASILQVNMDSRQWTIIKLTALAFALMMLAKKQREKLCVSILTGRRCINEILSGLNQIAYDSLRMNKDAFVSLCGHFRARGWVIDSQHIDVEQKMAIFLETIAHSVRNHIMKQKYQHSGVTISRCFHEVLRGMLHFSKEMIVPPNFQEPSEICIHKWLREGPFKGVIGVIDDTLISAQVPKSYQIPFRARGKGDCFQNVMAHTCIPSTFRGVRYWLKDFQRGGRPKTKEEHFNRAHAKLRNVIERTFGVLKARFPILKAMPKYKFSTQRNIVIACMAIHNYLRRISLNDELFTAFANEDLDLGNVQPQVHNGQVHNGDRFEVLFGGNEQRFMRTKRMRIAEELDAYYASQLADETHVV